MKKQTALVYIILVNYNGINDTINCIDSLSKIKYDNYKILVVDNASRDGSVKKIKDKNIELIELKENIGFAGGNNKGIEVALKENADYVLLLNNDTEVEPYFLNHLVDRAEKDKSIGCVGGKIYYFDNKNIIWFAGGKINRFTGKTHHIGADEIDKGMYDVPMEQDYITGCMMLVRTSVFRKTGFMKDTYFLYYEETDWCVRMRNDGYKLIYEPNAVIYHKVSNSTKNINEVVKYYYDRNSYWFIMNNYGLESKIFMFIYKRVILFLKFIKAYLNKNDKMKNIIKKTYIDIINKEMGKYND